MALFEEKKIQSGSNLNQVQIAELEKGKSILFFVGGFADRKSTEYGDFKVVEGLQLSLEAGSIESLIDSSIGASFIPNTLLLNQIEQSLIVTGRVYRIEKAWNKDEKFADGKRAKGYGYNTFELSVDTKTLAALNTKFMAVKANEPGVEKAVAKKETL